MFVRNIYIIQRVVFIFFLILFLEKKANSEEMNLDRRLPPLEIKISLLEDDFIYIKIVNKSKKDFILDNKKILNARCNLYSFYLPDNISFGFQKNKPWNLNHVSKLVKINWELDKQGIQHYLNDGKIKLAAEKFIAARISLEELFSKDLLVELGTVKSTKSYEPENYEISLMISFRDLLMSALPVDKEWNVTETISSNRINLNTISRLREKLKSSQ